ncbi:uncharacterized protein LOC121263546 [Juglans microcarpa x Juglans regia]|uniref:uncharacterized protein LOC121263546 n=1 Tax=Juglans microcarpa x Juglans regia TaxID=2249226 RepID=UPI001B7F261F|nr:uncharacterized protein LOC121263546 [Juglans microcarpa x Juglans regia]XP_041022433.1 uncharacterized protein LOC121263546 [Juglans microcarpa x Juglans regia]
MPKKMSFFCWRARQKAVPVDEVIQQLGIPLASKCCCCGVPNIETLDYALCEGKWPKKVWRYFSALWDSIARFLDLRWDDEFLVGTCGNFISGWLGSCASRMEGVSYDWRAVMRVVKVNLRDISNRLWHFKKMGANDLLVLQKLNCPIIPVRDKLPRLIAWKPPDERLFKLNVDGRSSGNLGRSGCGGIIHDYQGNVVAGFAHIYGHATNTIAECRAPFVSLAWFEKFINRIRFKCCDGLVSFRDMYILVSLKFLGGKRVCSFA